MASCSDNTQHAQPRCQSSATASSTHRHDAENCHASRARHGHPLGRDAEAFWGSDQQGRREVLHRPSWLRPAAGHRPLPYPFPRQGPEKAKIILAERALGKHGPSNISWKKDRPFNGWSKCKKELDKLAKIAPWTLHDLRRTFRTNLGRLRVRPDIAERLVNHAPARTEMEETYDLYT
jgi:hypothetical protein